MFNSILFILLSLLLYTMLQVFKKNGHIWIFSYFKQSFKCKIKKGDRETKHIIFCMVDHFEPLWNNADYNTEVRRVDTWLENYPKLANAHKDTDGKSIRYTFFYTAEEYRREHLGKLAILCKSDLAEVELHLHHNNDTTEGLKQKIKEFKERASGIGLLSRDKQRLIRFGFIHGNWALDNSRRDGKMCGINNELLTLKELGCYADFTLPSAPSDTQTKKINSIYYAFDDPMKPKSHNRGIDVEVGKSEVGDLMIIQGPIALNFKKRKWGIFPRIENSEISADNPPTRDRVDLWIKQRINVIGKPNWIFVKVYTHGCQEKNLRIIFGKEMENMLNYLESRYNDGIYYKLHYVTAREMFNIIKATEANENGEPGQYRDYILTKN